MVTRKKPAKNPKAVKPVGRDEVKTAVLGAARILFAERPYKDVTMRDIAKGAFVNLGLLHRHFGTKEVILHEVIQSYADQFREIALASHTPEEAMLQLFSGESQRALLRTLANLVLADLPVNAFIAHDGALSVLLRRGASRGAQTPTEQDTDVLLTFALFMGWSLFETFLIEASGNRVSHDTLRERTLALGRQLLTPPEPVPEAPRRRRAGL